MFTPAPHTDVTKTNISPASFDEINKKMEYSFATKIAKSPYCIRWNGNLLCIGGRCVWRGLASAKGAFTRGKSHCLNTEISSRLGGKTVNLYYMTDDVEIEYKKLLQELQDAKILEFIPFTEKL